MGKVIIGSNCFIGARTLILPNVIIGDNVIVGAGSVVTKNIPSNSVAVGNPCKVIKTYNEYMDRNKLLMDEKNTINKAPALLTDTEKETINEQIKGIWFIE